MKITIFGSTGSIGLHLVRQALDSGYSVTAFVRDPLKLNIKHSNLKMVQGDVLDLQSVENAIENQDAVLCSLGAGILNSTVRSIGTKNIIIAMEKKGVRRFICQTTLGVGDSWDNLNFYWKYIMFSGLLRLVYADHAGQEKYVKQSHLNWTIVRPGAFTDGDHTGEYRHGFSGTDKTLQLKISRADVADYMLKQLTDETNLHMTPGLSY